MKRSMLIALLVLALLPAGLALACPMCKDSIPNSDAASATSLPGGFNASVYYMLCGFLITLGLVTGVITKGVRSTNVQIQQKKDER